MEDRWGANYIPRDQQTPEQRIKRIIYWLLLLFCLFILLPTLYVSLNRGARGLRVTIMQERLRDLGYLADDADGIFGGMTEKAVKDFQGDAGLEASGVADVDTMAALAGRLVG